MRKALEVAARDEGSDGLLVILTPQAMTDPTATARELIPFAHIEGKPVLASWMGGKDVLEGAAILREAGIPTFDYPDQRGEDLQLTWRLARNLRQIYETPTLPSDEEHPVDRAKAEAIIDAARAEGRTLLTEDESKELLAAYGIPITETVVAPTIDEAVAAADRIGYPVVVKLYSHTITHKTDVGGVQLNLKDADAVRHAYELDPRLGDREEGRRALRGRDRPADGQLDRLRAHHRLLDRPAVRAGAALRDGRPARRGLQGPRARPAAAQHDARPADDGAARRSTRRSRASAGAAASTSASSSSSSSASASSSSSSAGSPSSTSTRCSPRQSGSSPSTPASSSTTRRPTRRTCRASRSGRTRAKYVSSWTCPDGESLTIRPIRPEDEPLMIDFHRSLSPGDGVQPLHAEPRLRRADGARAARPDLLPRLRPGDGARRRVREPGPGRAADRGRRPPRRGRSGPTTRSSRSSSPTRGRARASARSCCGGSSRSRVPRASPCSAPTCGPTTPACGGPPRRSASRSSPARPTTSSTPRCASADPGGARAAGRPLGRLPDSAAAQETDAGQQAARPAGGAPDIAREPIRSGPTVHARDSPPIPRYDEAFRSEPMPPS